MLSALYQVESIVSSYWLVAVVVGLVMHPKIGCLMEWGIHSMHNTSNRTHKLITVSGRKKEMMH